MTVRHSQKQRRYTAYPPRHPAAPVRYRPAIPRGVPQRKKPAQKSGLTTGLLIAGGAVLTFFILAFMVVAIGALFLFGGNTVLPGVRVAGVPLGGMTRSEAEAALAQAWANNGLVLRDQNRVFPNRSGDARHRIR
ncbi:MAG TPA: hypothetical protein VK003_14995 [Oceanobacillus sp.]|nr:hypothetical protein [Oceanobacillus sp.]